MDAQTPKSRPNLLAVMAAGAVYAFTIRYIFDTLRKDEPLEPVSYIVATLLLAVSLGLTAIVLKPLRNHWRNSYGLQGGVKGQQGSEGKR